MVNNRFSFCVYDSLTIGFGRMRIALSKLRVSKIRGKLASFLFFTFFQRYLTLSDIHSTVNEDGLVAIIHQPPLLSDHPDFTDTIDLRVHPDSTEYFKVHWDSNTFPNSSNSCGTCESVYRGCLCNINVLESSVFSSLPTENDIITQLHIGAFDPQILGSYNQVPNTGNVKVWHKNGGYSQNTIFEISYQGKQTFLKNIQSIVKIEGTQNQFRNPPSFINLAYREPFMAHHETDAVLENYFYNNNVAPFLAMRIIQKFGISNPSPLFIERVATGTLG